MAGKKFMLDGVQVNVSAMQVALYDALGIKEKADSSAKAALYLVVKGIYPNPDVPPTYEQYSSDLKALKAQCETAGKAFEYYRAQYAGAVMSMFKKLPESTSPDALKKKAQREAKKAKEAQALINAGLRTAPKKWVPVDMSGDESAPKAPSKAGAPAGQTQVHPTSIPETIEQLVTRFGMIETLDAITRILAGDKSTEMPAKALASLSAQLRRDLKPADVTPTPAKQSRKRKAA